MGTACHRLALPRATGTSLLGLAHGHMVCGGCLPGVCLCPLYVGDTVGTCVCKHGHAAGCEPRQACLCVSVCVYLCAHLCLHHGYTLVCTRVRVPVSVCPCMCVPMCVQSCA